jgi:hypothetical protein
MSMNNQTNKMMKIKSILKETLAIVMAFAVTAIGIFSAITSLVLTVQQDGWLMVITFWVLSFLCWLPLLGYWRQTYLDYFDRFFKK